MNEGTCAANGEFLGSDVCYGERSVADYTSNMPIFTMRITNATFESFSSGEFVTIEDAYRAAVVAGAKIASDELQSGVDSSIVQVSVNLVGHREVMRGAVSLSTAHFFTPD